MLMNAIEQDRNYINREKKICDFESNFGSKLMDIYCTFSMKNPEMPLKKQNIEMKNISNQREIKVENGVKHLNNFMVFRQLKRFMECCGLNYLKKVFKQSQMSQIL